jgi:hypothetical protein
MTSMTPNSKSTVQPRRAFVAKPATERPVRREYRSRDFGIGYGSSSGYASGKRYADNWGNARFVCG